MKGAVSKEKETISMQSNRAGNSSGASSLDQSPTFPPRIPDYELFRCIGVGSYGEVWLARSVLGEYRAVKVVYRCRFEHERPYEREFQGIENYEPISRTHDSQVDILHVGRNDPAGYFYYVMELADDANVGQASRLSPEPATIEQPSDGLARNNATKSFGTGGTPILLSAATYVPRTLKSELTKHGRLAFDRCVEIGLALTTALEHIHGQGLVHRDVKPSNIIFVNGVPKLADIGLVTGAGEACSLVGTEGYMAPEGPGTAQADLYSLGKVLYEISMGRKGQVFPELPPDWDELGDKERLLELNEIILKACQGNLDLRYKSAAEMRAELELLQKGRSVKRRQAWQQCVRYAKKFALTLGALAVVAAVVVGFLHPFTRPAFSGDGPPSRNQDANILTADGLLIVRGDNYADFGKAYTNFQKAIKFDPSFVRPYAGLLELQLREWHPGIKSMDQDDLRAIVQQLEKLGPKLAATHHARAVLSYEGLDFPQARTAILKAIEADPEYELARTTHGIMLVTWGWPMEARKQLEISRTLAPSKGTIYCFMGHTYRAERDYTNAIAWYQKTLEYRPQHAFAYGALKETYEARGDYENSIQNAEKESLAHGGDPIRTKRTYDALRQAFRERGVRGYYQLKWERAEKNPNEESYWKACLQMCLGNTDAALDWLKKSVQTRLRNGSAEGNLQWLLVHDCWDPVRDDPRFKKLLEESTFSKVMPPRK